MPEVIQPQAQPASAAPAAPVEQPISVAETVKAAFDKTNEAPNVSGQPAKPEAKTAEPVDPAKPIEAATPAEGETQEAQAERIRTDRIPVGWKGGAESWHKLDASAKTYIVERNKQFEQGIQRHAQAAGFANEMAREFQPYEAMLRGMQATPQSATRYLLEKFHTLYNGTPGQKQQLVMEMAKTAGVDFSGIARGEVPQVDSNVEALSREVQALRAWANGTQQSAQNAEQQYIHSEIERFAADPKNEHFEVLRPTMAALLQGGQAKDLQDAYDKSKWMNPEVRASLVNQQFAQDAEKRKKQAEEAQRASVSLNAAPPAASVSGGSDPKSVRDLIASGFATSGSGRV